VDIRKEMSMIYEVEVRQTTVGRVFIKADSEKEAEEAANRYIKDEYNLSSIYFDEIWNNEVWDVSETDVVDLILNDEEIIKAEDVL
jgi:hypothetical protein